MQILLNLSCTRTQHLAWSSPGRSHTCWWPSTQLNTGKKRRRQRYSIVSDSSFDYFKPTGDDFVRKWMSEIWSTSSKLLAFSRWHTVVVLMAYSRSFCHCLHWCLEPVSKDLHPGDRLPHIGYKRNPPKCILYLFGSVTIYLLSPVTIWHGSNHSGCRNIWS